MSLDMTDENKQFISDQEIQEILKVNSLQFELAMLQIEEQKKKIEDYLISRNFSESANILEQQLDSLKQELIFDIQMNFSTKKVAILEEEFFLEEKVNQFIDRKSFSENVVMAYQRYISRANGLLVDTVYDLSNYFPEEFNREEYLKRYHNQIQRVKRRK